MNQQTAAESTAPAMIHAPRPAVSAAPASTTPTDGALQAMQRHGGGFTQQLARLWQVADAENRAVLEWTDVYGELFAQYNLTAERLANPSGMVWWARTFEQQTRYAPGDCGDWFRVEDDEHVDQLRADYRYEVRQFRLGVTP